MVAVPLLGVATVGVIFASTADSAPSGLYGWISTGGLIAFLLYFFLYAVPKKWVPRELYDSERDDFVQQIAEEQERTREWRDIALDSKALTRQQLTITEAALLRGRGRG